MKSTDEDAFAAMLTGVMTDVYDKAIKPTLIDLWIASLQPYELADVQTALMRYITHPADCKFPPKPGDIIRHLPTAATDDGHPGADEAWGLLVRLMNDERETGVLTEETPASLDSVAGLLEGPDASPQDFTTSQRLRDLAQLLRDLRVESERQWAEQRMQEREAATEQKRQALAAAEAECAKRGLRTLPHDQQKAA